MIQIVKDINILKKVSDPVGSVAESIDIIEKLKETLNKEKNGVGLAAIQIGINKKISVLKKEHCCFLHHHRHHLHTRSNLSSTINNKQFFYLINPKIIEVEDEFLFFNEGCLSFPDQFFNTYRYKHFTIENSRIDGNQFKIDNLYFYYPTEKEDERFISYNKIASIAIQHEIDHFDGKIIPEFCVKNVPIEKEKNKIGRNDLCPCGSGKKYKKCCLK